MKITLSIICCFLLSCATTGVNTSYYDLRSGMGWEAKITAGEVKNYVSWNQAIDLLLATASEVENVSQGHNLQVNIFLNDGTVIGTIEPDIDTIVMVLRKCGQSCDHIGVITQ